MSKDWKYGDILQRRNRKEVKVIFSEYNRDESEFFSDCAGNYHLMSVNYEKVGSIKYDPLPLEVGCTAVSKNGTKYLVVGIHQDVVWCVYLSSVNFDGSMYYTLPSKCLERLPDE